MADASRVWEEGGGVRDESERTRTEVAKMEQAIESDISKAVVGLREHFRGGRSTPTRGGAPDREGAPLDAADAEVATIAAFRSEAAAARDDMLDGLSRLRRDLEVHRRGAEPPQPEAAMPRLEAAVAAAQLRRARSPERWQPHAADGAPAPSASGGSEGPSFEVEIAQLRASLSLLGARVAALERSSERMLLAGAQGGDIDATLRDPLATHVVFGAGEHALARAEGAGSVVSRGELCALIADEVRSHTERVAGHLRADAMAHNVELRADFARRLEVVEEELHSAAARRPHGVDAAASLQPQRQHGAGGADEPWSARAAEERRAQLGEDPLISWDLKLSLERLVERVSETAGGTPTVAPAVATPSASTPCATGHGELGGSFVVQPAGVSAPQGGSPAAACVQTTPFLGGRPAPAVGLPVAGALRAWPVVPGAAVASYPGAAPAPSLPIAVTAVTPTLAQHVVALPAPRAGAYAMPPAPQSPRAGVRRREEEEGAATRSLLGRDAPGLCSSLDPEAQRVQVVDCEADALSASIRSTRAPDLLESKDLFQRCLQELKEENDALRLGNSLDRAELLARPAGVSTTPVGQAPSPQPVVVRSHSPRARSPAAPQPVVVVHHQPRASSPVRGVASAPHGQLVRQRSPSPLRAGAWHGS